MDLQAIAEALKAVGYEGSLAQEFLGMKNEDPVLKDAAIRKGMDYLRKL